MTSYMSGCTGAYLENGVQHSYDIGLMIQPRNSYHSRVGSFPTWCADNGAFSKKHPVFDPEVFRAMVRRPNLRRHRATCRFIVAPDVLRVLGPELVVGDAAATLAQYPRWAEYIHRHGFPVALVAQDGLEELLGEVPWREVDVLFLGGSTEWKLGTGAASCVAAAQAHGKATHMGRVNSERRLKIADAMGCDTADGTYLGFGPRKNLPKLLGWLDRQKGGPATAAHAA